MAVAANADDYAVARQNVFFPGVIPYYDGQCVSLAKWFMGEMSQVPDWNGARGNAKDVGRTLVAQGHAYEVPYNERRRGDIICYEYGLYGHIAIQLSGGRVFEQNVNMPGTTRKWVVDDYVYSSRIGSENESWRGGKNPHIYRLKTYSEKGVKKMVDGNDVNDLFIGILFRLPNAEEVARYNGKVDGGTLARELNGCAERQALIRDTILDEEAARILAVAVLGRPEPLETTEDLRWHIGGRANAKIKEFWYSDEGKAANSWHQHLPKSVESLTKQVQELSGRPTKQQLEDAQKAAATANADLQRVNKQVEADTQTGNSVIRWLGRLFNGNKES